VSPARPKQRVVVDGSNLATEGRSEPSLSQLETAVAAFASEHPGAEIIVVADASFGHRIPVSERARFREAEANQEIVTPPAGAVGRGDAFILKIADRINGVVLSNDSFQEFHGDYPWLFDEGRLIGGKPVPGVGWVFTHRNPVRADKASRVAKKEARPAAETSLSPAKKTVAAKKTAKKAAKKTDAKSVKKVAKSTAKGTKKLASKATKAAKSSTKTSPTKKIAPTPLLTRERKPVNPEAAFSAFRSTCRIGAKCEGEVTAFTSHGASVKVSGPGWTVECYAPNANLGSPAPTRARDVMKRGERRTFKLVSVDPDRRTAELALA
jgi:Zc3h12a-like Ribonuclease NYN domain